MNRYGPTESSAVKFARAAPLLVASFLYIIYHLWTRQSTLLADPLDFASHHASLNRTLGFGGILVAVVPSTTAEHFHHQLHTLSLASHRTNIDLKTFEGGGDKKFTKVWRGHMNMLRYMLDQKLETALILEGTVDWDLRVKDQLQRLSEALPDATHDRPYGTGWMALWLSRCGPESSGLGQPLSTFADASVLSTNSEDASHDRSVFRSGKSGCTVAYAVTAAGAQKILDEIGFEHVNLALEKAEGKTYNLPGLVVQPPLFEEWAEEDSVHAKSSPQALLGQSVRKALYSHG